MSSEPISHAVGQSLMVLFIKMIFFFFHFKHLVKWHNVNIFLTCHFLENVPIFILGSFMCPDDDKKLILPCLSVYRSPMTIKMNSHGTGVLVCT